MTIRFATPADAPDLLAIYALYIQETTISFEYEAPSVDEFADRIRAIQQQLPYLVAEADRDESGTVNQPGRILGYAYASRHRDRMAYQWSVDTSVYLHPDAHRRGIARALYTRLFDLLRRQGYYNAYAGITLPNLPSERLHRTLGFEPVGTYPNVGYKMGAWHDVLWLRLTLQPHQPEPVPPVAIDQL